MKRFLVCLLFAWLNVSYAQTSCPVPEKKAVIFFGNGIATSEVSARNSLRLLHRYIGDSYNSQFLRYDLAYNQTDGIAADLAQSVMQAGAQWDSQIMGWLNDLGVVPDWFASWYEHYVLAAMMTFVPELDQHVEKYRTAIRFGQKVVVVSHSQGNFYVNEAKRLLAQEMTSEQMRSFSIFGVATPANNVGGDSGPYYTNHRDIILQVPGSLPANWILRRSDGSVADDLPRLDAHYFEATYMSDDFNIKAPLLMGIKGKLAGLPAPVPDCDNYRKHFIGQLAGTFPAKCNGNAGAAGLDAEAQASFPNGTVDLSGTTIHVGFVKRQLINTASSGDNTGIGLQAGSVYGSWSLSGEFKQLLRSEMDCHKTPDVSTSSLAKPVDIAAKAAVLMRDYRGVFPRDSCLTLNKATNSYTSNALRMPIFVEGTALSIGDNVYDLSANRQFEAVVIPAANSFIPFDYEPQFVFNSITADGQHLWLTYKQFKGLRSFLVDSAASMLSCNLD
ncbi:hypothetical protein EGT07_00415 [Herbaspirillum sp. HC18]|nr:hypothetical protein EGT07_00415 [Herbaspirillum sp. HC18]